MFRKLSLATCLAVFCGAYAAPLFAGEEENEPPDLYSFKNIPTVWIGVQIAEVPRELKAHLKRGELMLVNIAIGSPADLAGLDRYDVVLSFNGREITDMDVLLKAIQQNGPDKRTSMVVIHEGVEKTVTIAPIMSDPADMPKYKYEEEQIVETKPVEKYFGHRAKVGPDGVMLFTPQGRLDQLPNDIRIMLEGLPRDIEDFTFYQDFNLDGDAGLPMDDDARQRTTVNVRIQEDGGALMISRDAEGVFTVERDGAETNVYQSKEELRQGDPEAYKLFHRSLGGSTFFLPPDWQDLRQQQRKFQEEMLSKLKRTEERRKGSGE